MKKKIKLHITLKNDGQNSTYVYNFINEILTNDTFYSLGVNTHLNRF